MTFTASCVVSRALRVLDAENKRAAVCAHKQLNKAVRARHVRKLSDSGKSDRVSSAGNLAGEWSLAIGLFGPLAPGLAPLPRCSPP